MLEEKPCCEPFAVHLCAAGIPTKPASGFHRRILFGEAAELTEAFIQFTEPMAIVKRHSLFHVQSDQSSIAGEQVAVLRPN